MKKIWQLAIQLQIWRDEHGQDLIEYAMIAGFLAVTSGMALPGCALKISTVLSKVTSTMTGAAAQS
jgi:pilus assembly protein Flp/PilA